MQQKANKLNMKGQKIIQLNENNKQKQFDKIFSKPDNYNIPNYLSKRNNIIKLQKNQHYKSKAQSSLKLRDKKNGNSIMS